MTVYTCRPYDTAKTSFYSASARSFDIPTFLIEISHLPLYLMYLVEHLSSIEEAETST
jgi:hypothetical protein